MPNFPHASKLQQTCLRWISAFLMGSLLSLPATPLSAQTPPPPPVAGDAPATNPNADAKSPSVPANVARAAKQRVLVLRTEGGGVASDPQRAAVIKELQSQAMRYKQLDITLSNADLVEEMFEFECTEAGVECLGKIGNKYGAQLVVFSEIAKNPAGTLVLSMRLIDVQQSRAAQFTQQPLDNPDKPSTAVSHGLVVLLGPADLPADQVEVPGTLVVTLFGGGTALVYVDDKLAGKTGVAGLKATVAAGVHTVRVVRAGFREWTGRVTVPPGGQTEQTVTLEQMAEVIQVPDGPGKTTDKPLVKKWWFWTIVGVVVAGGVATAILLNSGTKTVKGATVFSMDQNDAHLDPIFAGKK